MPYAAKSLMRKAKPHTPSVQQGNEALSPVVKNPCAMRTLNKFATTEKAGYLCKIPALFFAANHSLFRRINAVRTVALFVAGCILFSSLAPAYGQALDNARATRGAVSQWDMGNWDWRDGAFSGAVDEAVRSGSGSGVSGAASMRQKYGLVKALVEGMEEVGDIEGAGIAVSRQSGERVTAEVALEEVDIKDSRAVAAAREREYAKFLADEAQRAELDAQIAAQYEAARLELEAQGKEPESLETYRERYYKGYKAEWDRTFKQNLQNYQAAYAKAEQDYIKGLIGEVWSYYYKAGESEKLSFLATEAMGIFKVGGYLSKQQEEQVATYLRKQLKDWKYCTQKKADEKRCERGIKSLMAMGIFGKEGASGVAGEPSDAQQLPDGHKREHGGGTRYGRS